MKLKNRVQNTEGARKMSMGKILNVFLAVFFYLLSAISYPLSYAQSPEKETSALQQENARLQAELNKIGFDREGILKSLKIVTEDNARFKDEISNLQQVLIKLDNARKSSDEINRVLSKRLAELQDKLQPIKEAEGNLKEAQGSLDKYKEKTAYLEKSVNELKEVIGGLEIERVEYTERKKAIDKQLKDAIDGFCKNSEELKQLRIEAALMHYNLGVIFQKANKWRDALVEYNKVLETSPDDADTHFNLALIYDTVKNDRAKAIYHYKKYLATNPSVEDNAKVKERITALNAENHIWGEPHLGGIKEKTGRLFW